MFFVYLKFLEFHLISNIFYWLLDSEFDLNSVALFIPYVYLLKNCLKYKFKTKILTKNLKKNHFYKKRDNKKLN